MDKSSKKIEELKIRKMSREEAGFAVEMAAAEGWNPGTYDGKLKGYDVIRKCLKGYKIGPLFADNRTQQSKYSNLLSACKV